MKLHGAAEQIRTDGVFTWLTYTVDAFEECFMNIETTLIGPRMSPVRARHRMALERECVSMFHKESILNHLQFRATAWRGSVAFYPLNAEEVVLLVIGKDEVRLGKECSTSVLHRAASHCC